MRVHTTLPQASWRDAGPAARHAEAAGFDALMTVELGHDPLPPLAFAALETFRVELTPSVVVAFPRSPTTLAADRILRFHPHLSAHSGAAWVGGSRRKVASHRGGWPNSDRSISGRSA
jgi:hypothetical protein